MQASQIPAKFPIPFAADAGSGYIRAIPTASQILITPGAASLTDGFPPVTFIDETSGGTPPFGQDMNGILNQITAWIQWTNAGAPVVYDAAFSASIGGYPKNALLTSAAGGTWWLSTVDNNTTDPDTGGAGWRSITLGVLATLGIGAGLQNVSGNLALKLSTPLALDANGNLILNIGAGLQNSSGNLTLKLADSSLRVGSSGLQGSTPITPLSGTATVVAASNQTSFVGVGALNLPQTTTLWNGFCFAVSATTGAVTLTPNITDAFNGGADGAVYTLAQGSSALFITDAADNWWIFNLSIPQVTPETPAGPYNYAYETGFIL
jgi:hypothetical protein